MYTVIDNRKEIQSIVDLYFIGISDYQLKRTLKRFLKKEGMGIEFIGFLFKDELVEEFEGYGKLKDDEILIFADYPAFEEDVEAHIKLNEFYHYLEISVNKALEEAYKYNEKYNIEEIKNLLLKMKNTFNIK